MNGQQPDVKAAAEELGYDSAEEYLMALHELHQNGQIHVPPKNAPAPDPETQRPQLYFERADGEIYHGDSAKLMADELGEESVDLIVTSPPFGLLKEKDYGNKDADAYLNWFDQFASGFRRVLKESGSLVIDIGGAWKRGRPVRSLYHFELLIRLCRAFDFKLAQEFYWWNPAKLPLPAEWVNIRRIRVRDSVNCLWWLSKTPYPKASNKRVLQPYKEDMTKLFERGSYNTGERSGGHKPGETSFLNEHGGAIPHNLISLANTSSNTAYHKYCREKNHPIHPARFPSGIPAFFIRMLTDKGDTVFDPFAGSCMTGEVAEQMGREWICCDLEEEYLEGALGRFLEDDDSLFPSYEPSRSKPYEAVPPFLSILPEDEAPLPEDGGASRPSN